MSPTEPTNLEQWQAAADEWNIGTAVRALGREGFSCISPPTKADETHGELTVALGPNNLVRRVRLSNGVCTKLIQLVLAGHKLFKLESADWNASPPKYVVKALD